MVIALGIEASANKLGIGIVCERGHVYSNVRETYISPPGTGFKPQETAQHHRKHILSMIKNVRLHHELAVYKLLHTVSCIMSSDLKMFSLRYLCADQAIEASNLNIEDIELICYTKGPGMGATLSVGAIVARVLSLMWNLPLVAVNHCIAHIEMGRVITKAANPTVLYVSGGNTQVITYTKHRYTIVGETLDIAVGNCFDRVARLLNLSNDPSPGFGIECLAMKGENLLDLPYVVKGMDISLSGVVTQIEAMLKSNTDLSHADICFSLQEYVFAMLVEITERAMTQVGSEEVLLVGGVGCNKRLQEMLTLMLDNRGGRLCAMDANYCIDNGAMIAYTGILDYQCNNITPVENATYCQRYRTDNVHIAWRD